MMMMSNTAKKKDSRTPRMICSSLVNRPSTTERGRGDRLDNVTQKQHNRLYRFCFHLLIQGSIHAPAVLTCSEYSESVDWPLTLVALNLNLVNNSWVSALCCRKMYTYNNFKLLCALTRRPCWASEVHCRNYRCCSPSYSHHSLRSRTFLPCCDCASPGAGCLWTRCYCLWRVRPCVMPRPPQNMVGWGTPCQSGKGQDDQKMLFSSWSGYDCPSLWQELEKKETHITRRLSQISADIKPLWFLLTFCLLWA